MTLHAHAHIAMTKRHCKASVCCANGLDTIAQHHPLLDRERDGLPSLEACERWVDTQIKVWSDGKPVAVRRWVNGEERR